MYYQLLLLSLTRPTLFQELKRKKTAVVKHDDCPQFQESFNLRIEEDDLQQAGLKFTCMQHQPILERGERSNHDNNNGGFRAGTGGSCSLLIRVIFHMSSPGLKMRVDTSAPHTLGLHWS